MVNIADNGLFNEMPFEGVINNMELSILFKSKEIVFSSYELVKD